MTSGGPELGYASAFLLGLFGNVHCIAMCGGIVAAFSQASPPRARGATASITTPLLYNLGRIASYGVAGTLAGAFGLIVAGLLGASGALVLRGTFGLLLIAAGLQLAGLGRLLAPLERIAQPLFATLSKAVARLRPADRTWKALLLGAIWGWLPCGLVYAALLGAAAAGSAPRGAALMLCFGLGTLPVLVAAGAAAERLRGVIGRSPVRAAAGITVVVFGLWTLSGALFASRHFGHAGAQAAAVPQSGPQHQQH